MAEALSETLTQIIKQRCINAGFIKAGVAKAEPLEREGIYLKHWLDEGKNAGMQWMKSSFDKRVSPALIMQNVKSIISLAYLYDTPFLHSEDVNIPKISRYAWGERDYHKIIKSRLKKLCNEIEELSDDLKTKFYIDDGPVMDKAWAARSGVGWIGKNTNVINSEFGSFFFLATILVNTELEYDQPVDDLCKNCNLCVNACPTGAIYDEYNLDANLCISYQTIENRNEIPDELDLNGWIFGCDICQDVCPFNSNKFFTEDSQFFPRAEIYNKSVEELQNINEEQFNKVFEGTPVRRTKYSGWKRNLEKFMKG